MPRMRELALLGLMVALGFSALGCQGTGRPQWRGPGSMQAQQMQAQRFDPYPDNVAGPAVDGGRPPSFENPPAEVTRARWTKWNMPFFGR